VEFCLQFKFWAKFAKPQNWVPVDMACYSVEQGGCSTAGAELLRAAPRAHLAATQLLADRVTARRGCPGLASSSP